MQECQDYTLQERLKSYAIGVGLAVWLMVICWGATMLTWATTDHTLTYASNHPSQHMEERPAILASGGAISQVDFRGEK